MRLLSYLFRRDRLAISLSAILLSSMSVSAQTTSIPFDLLPDGKLSWSADIKVGKQISTDAILTLSCEPIKLPKPVPTPSPVSEVQLQAANVASDVRSIEQTKIGTDRIFYEKPKPSVILINEKPVTRGNELDEFLKHCTASSATMNFVIDQELLAPLITTGLINVTVSLNGLVPIRQLSLDLSGRLEFSDSETLLSTNRNFMSRRAETLASSGPSLSEFHGRLGGGSSSGGGGGQAGFAQSTSSGGSATASRLGNYSFLGDNTNSLLRPGVPSYIGAQRPLPQLFDFSGSGTESAGRLRFATSLVKIMKAREAQRASLASGQPGLALDDSGQTGIQNLPFNIWTQGQLSYFSDDLGGGDRKGHTGLAFLGADIVLSPSLLVGVLVQYDWMDESSSALSTEADGEGWMAGPYLSARVTDRVFFDVRAAWGQSDNDVEQVGFSKDSFDTTRTLVAGSLTGSWEMAGIRFSPSVAVTYFREKQEAYLDSVNNPVPEQTITLGRANVSTGVSYTHQTDSGTIIEPHVKIHALWDFDKDETANVGGLIVSTQELRGKIEGGLRITSPTGVSVRAGGAYDGLGDEDLDIYEGQVFVIVPFD